MITQSDAWSEYNHLANKVREAIVRLAIEKINIGLRLPSEFRFDDNNIEYIHTACIGDIVVGLAKEDNEVKVMMEGEIEGEANYSLHSPYLTLVDLMNILEKLEAYES